jgi:hypothetical protein
MAEMSDYLEEKLLDHTLGTTAYTHPSDVFVSLHTADPVDAGTGTEVSAGSYTYARQTCAFNAAGTNAAGVTENTAIETWTNLPACTVTHIGIWDAVSSGNLLYHTAVDSSKTVANGDTISIAVGAITVTLA